MEFLTLACVCLDFYETAELLFQSHPTFLTFPQERGRVVASPPVCCLGAPAADVGGEGVEM